MFYIPWLIDDAVIEQKPICKKISLSTSIERTATATSVIEKRINIDTSIDRYVSITTCGDS